MGLESSSALWFECNWNLFMEGLLSSRRQHVLVLYNKYYSFSLSPMYVHMGNNSLVPSPLVCFLYRNETQKCLNEWLPHNKATWLPPHGFFRSLTQVLGVKNMGESFQKLAFSPHFWWLYG